MSWKKLSGSIHKAKLRRSHTPGQTKMRWVIELDVAPQPPPLGNDGKSQLSLEVAMVAMS